MFSNTAVKVTFYKGEKVNTEKVVYGWLSEAVRAYPAEGKNVQFEKWNARFMGNAYHKALALQDGDTITVTQWAARNWYDKENKKNFPYIMVLECDLITK